MNTPTPPAAAESPVPFELDSQSIMARPGESILQAAKRHGVAIPHLCRQDGLRSDGNCRAPTAGMRVQAASPRARKSRQMVVEMLLSDMPDAGYRWNDEKPVATELTACDVDASSGSGRLESKRAETSEPAGQHGELSAWATRLGVSVRPALKALRREQPAPDLSHPAMAVNLDACIQCNRCVRACRESQVNDVIGYALRGADAKIVFDLDDPMADSTCVDNAGAHAWFEEFWGMRPAPGRPKAGDAPSGGSAAHAVATGTTKVKSRAWPPCTTRCARPCMPASTASAGRGCSAIRA